MDANASGWLFGLAAVIQALAAFISAYRSHQHQKSPGSEDPGR